MKLKHQLTLNQKAFGTMLHHQSAFIKHFWKDDITLPMSTRQKVFHNSVARKVIHATGRKSSKTIGLEARIIRKGLMQYNRVVERMIVTAGEKQMEPLRDRIVARISRVPLFKMMVLGFNRNEGVIRWAGGLNDYLRIEGTSGTDANMVGLRAFEILMDEAQLGNPVCHNSRIQSALPNCYFLYCGVPDGRRGTVFHDIDQTNAGREWTHFKTSTYVNPLYWHIEERDKLQVAYGGKNSQYYVTQVLGQWGSESVSSFPPENIAIHKSVFSIARFSPKDMTVQMGDALFRAKLAGQMSMPRVSGMVCIGMDYGSKQDPTEIILAYSPDGTDDVTFRDWYQFMRIEIVGANQVEQAYFLQYLVEIIGQERVGIVCIDLLGSGGGIEPVLKQTSLTPLWWQNRLIDFNAGGTIVVKSELRSDDAMNQIVEQKWKRKFYFTRQFQAWMINARNNLPDSEHRLWIADDEDAFQELVSTTERKMDSGNIQFVPPMKNPREPIDHITDGYRALCCAIYNMNKLVEIEGAGSVTKYRTDQPLFGKPPSRNNVPFGIF